MSQETQEQLLEKAAALDRIGKALLPADKLSPWMGWYPKMAMLATVIFAKTTHEVAMELERQSWRLIKKRKFVRAPSADSDVFDTTELVGAAYMLGFCCNCLAKNVHNYLPSFQGLRARQAMSLGQAQKTGVSTEPKKPGLFDRIFRRGKQAAQVSGGGQ
jgi:hypothetical protein